VNGPEVLSKFVGDTEKNVRDLFADAEQDQRTRGNGFIYIHCIFVKLNFHIIQFYCSLFYRGWKWFACYNLWWNWLYL